MKKLLPELLGTMGYGLACAGLYLWLGAGLALTIGGVLLMLGAYLAAGKGGA